MNIREKILIVEDEKSIAHFISTILTANGYEAMRASTGAEAMSMISSHCPDLVILDLGLPDMDGLDILRQIRSWSALPVVVVSARSHEQDKVSALDLGLVITSPSPSARTSCWPGSAPPSAIPAPPPATMRSPGRAPTPWAN